MAESTRADAGTTHAGPDGESHTTTFTLLERSEALGPARIMSPRLVNREDADRFRVVMTELRAEEAVSD